MLGIAYTHETDMSLAAFLVLATWSNIRFWGFWFEVLVWRPSLKTLELGFSAMERDGF